MKQAIGQASFFDGAAPLKITKPIRLIEVPIGGGILIGVGADGSIYTSDHKNVRSNGRVDNRSGKKIKPAIDRYGYLRCTFSNGRERKSYYVHRLVAMAFIPNPDGKPTVNHINGVKTDNRAENLEWATQAEQKHHAIKTGLASNNVSALELANEKRKLKILFKGKVYDSVKSAHRETGYAEGTIRKYGEVMP